jgi:hypothetical protein
MVVPGGILGGFNASTGVAGTHIFAGTFTGPPFEFALAMSDGGLAWQCPANECTTFSFGPPGIAPEVVFMGDDAGCSARSTRRPARYCGRSIMEAASRPVPPS